MSLLDLTLIGSFQDGRHEWSETPLEDIWERIALLGYPDLLKTVFKASVPPETKASIERYAATRLRQCIEFRAAHHTGTLLTSPLPLYYSFLSLTRAFSALHSDRVPSKKAHGLTFKMGATILDSTATVCEGTFSEWLAELGAPAPVGLTLTLERCLASIFEITPDYYTVLGRWPRATTVQVRGKQSGLVTLLFHPAAVGGEEWFRGHWESEYPTLASVCGLEPDGCALKVKQDIDTGSYEAISKFCSQHLEVNLVPSGSPTWYLLRHLDAEVTLPRPAYYFCAAFILSSITRYEPDGLMNLIAEPSATAWLLERFLKAADRFFPNLMLNWLTDEEWFFGSSV